MSENSKDMLETRCPLLVRLVCKRTILKLVYIYTVLATYEAKYLPRHRNPCKLPECQAPRLV
jgi:hypothetical protein